MPPVATWTPVAVLFELNRIFWARVFLYTTRPEPLLRDCLRKLDSEVERCVFLGLMVKVAYAEPNSLPLLRPLIWPMPTVMKALRAQVPNASTALLNETSSGPPEELNASAV